MTARVFDIPETGKPTEATQRQVTFLRAFLFDKTATDENWQDSMNALVALLGQQLLKSSDPDASIRNVIAVLQHLLRTTR